MTCRRVRKLMPLFVGDDLRPGQAAAVRDHIDACPGCREEFEAFRAAMAGIKAAAKAEGVAEWREGEWNALMARVTAEDEGRRGSLRQGRGARSRTAMGCGFGPRRRRSGWSFSPCSSGARPSSPEGYRTKGSQAIASGRSPQDKVAMTMVSPETGLQVVWILDKNFDWKGDQE